MWDAAPAAPVADARDLASVRPDDLDIPIARHQYPLGVVAGSLALVLRAGVRLRRVAAVLAMHWRWCNLDVRIASYYSARLWLLRLGLYQLSRPKIQADDWIWIADHTMQLGERKCLILVGLRQSNWDADGAHLVVCDFRRRLDDRSGNRSGEGGGSARSGRASACR